MSRLKLLPVSDVVKHLSNLNSGIVLNQASRPDFQNVPFHHIVGENSSLIEELLYADWNTEVYERKGIPPDAEQFWVGIRKKIKF